MNDSKKTAVFAFSAVGMTALAALSWFLTQPSKSNDYSLVGKEFYEDFQGSGNAASLEVTAIDPETTNRRQFRVEEKNGIWSIPSHYGYPAEATDRLATTASSLIGVTRDSLVGRLAKDHERFGVVDPTTDDLVDPDAAGKRITIRDEDGETLVDLIVGKQADESSLSDTEVAFGQTQSDSNYYVRRPDETQTYKVALDLQLSTKFSDWIRPDLLDLDGPVVRRIVVDNYELKEQSDPLGRLVRLFKKQGDQITLTRENGFGPWLMTGLPDDKKLDSAKVDKAVATLEALKIVGVRKKTDYQGQPLLNADLTLNQIPELQQNPQQFQMVIAELQQELNEYGFNLTPVAQNSSELALVSNFGELAAGTEEGVAYTLQFGNPIEGDDDEIEIGLPKSDDQGETVDPDAADAADAADGDGADGADGADGGDETKSKDTDAAGAETSPQDVRNRFLMIRVAFDEALLGEKPVAPDAPVEPQQPEGYVPAPETDGKQPDDADATPEPAPAPADNETADITDGQNEDADSDSEESTEESTDDRPAEFRDYELARQVYDANKTEYEIKLAQFNDDIKEFNVKVSAGQKRVAELNERFGAWFYVISADNLESLQLTKDELVSDKEPVTAPGGQPAGLPNRPNINLDDLMPNLPADEGQTPPDNSPSLDSDGDPSGATGEQTDAGAELSGEGTPSAGDPEGGNPEPGSDQPRGETGVQPGEPKDGEPEDGG